MSESESAAYHLWEGAEAVFLGKLIILNACSGTEAWPSVSKPQPQPEESRKIMEIKPEVEKEIMKTHKTPAAQFALKGESWVCVPAVSHAGRCQAGPPSLLVLALWSEGLSQFLGLLALSSPLLGLSSDVTLSAKPVKGAGAQSLPSAVQLCNPARLFRPWGFPGQNVGVGSHSLLQWIFPTQELNQHLLLGRQILYHWATWEAPRFPVTVSSLWPCILQETLLAPDISESEVTHPLSIRVLFSPKRLSLSVRQSRTAE